MDMVPPLPRQLFSLAFGVGLSAHHRLWITGSNKRAKKIPRLQDGFQIVRSERRWDMWNDTRKTDEINEQTALD
jgi:hypothetical protein